MKPLQDYYRRMVDEAGNKFFGFDLLGFAKDRAEELYPKNPAKREAYIQGTYDANQVLQVGQKHNKTFKVRLKSFVSFFKRN